jgi:Tfp pilus assembly protein PilF
VVPAPPAPDAASPPAPGAPSPPLPERPALPTHAPRSRWLHWAVGIAATGVLGSLLWMSAAPKEALAPAPAAPIRAADAPPPGLSERERATELIEQARRHNIAPGDRRANWLAARDLLAQALALDPGNPRAHAEMVFNLTNTVLNGFSLNPAADLRTAETHAERAIALGPELPATHAARAAVMRHQRRFEEALASYRRGVEIDPTQHASRANAGLMLVFLGRPEEGEALVRANLSLAPPTHGFRLTWLTYLSLALAQQERWGDAAEALRASLDGQAFLPVPVRLALLAGILERAGDRDGARLAARQAMAQNADLRVEWFRANPFSDHPAFVARQETLLAAMAAAGLAE